MIAVNSRDDSGSIRSERLRPNAAHEVKAQYHTPHTIYIGGKSLECTSSERGREFVNQLPRSLKRLLGLRRPVKVRGCPLEFVEGLLEGRWRRTPVRISPSCEQHRRPT